MKKLLLTTCALFVTCSAFADNDMWSDQSSAQYWQSKNKAYEPTAYIEGSLGWDYHGFISYRWPEDINLYNHGNSGFAGGIDAGYHFMPHLGVEAGLQYLFQTPKQKSNGHKITGAYAAYVAASVTATMNPHLDVYGLAGFGFNHITDNDGVGRTLSPTDARSGSAWGFMYGAGLRGHLPHKLILGAKYVRVAGNTKSRQNGGPTVRPQQYFLATFGVAFK